MTRKTNFGLTLLSVTIGFVGILAIHEVTRSDPTLAVEQTAPVVYEFNPIRKEFKLDNGTPCVMVWAPRRAQSAGISCDWGYNSRFNVN